MNAVEELKRKLAAEQRRQKISQLWVRHFFIAICVWAALVVLPVFIIGEVAYVWGFIVFFFGISCLSWWTYRRAQRQADSENH